MKRYQFIFSVETHSNSIIPFTLTKRHKVEELEIEELTGDKITELTQKVSEEQQKELSKNYDCQTTAQLLSHCVLPTK